MRLHLRPLLLAGLAAFAGLPLGACSNDAAPRLIAGGGIGDGAIDGRVNVHVIDNATDAPIANATVHVGSKDQTTDEKGLVIFKDVEGPQTISVKAEGFRSAVWVAANGANVTIPLNATTPPVPDQATLTGTISAWGSITVPQGHVKAAFVFYSQSDDLGDAANNIQTPGGGNVCGVLSATCNWTVATRTGALTLVAMIIDRDTKNTPTNPNDDTTSVIGWATRAVTVEKGVNQSGIDLMLVEAGNLENVAINLGTPPAGLTQTNAIVGVEVAADNVIQMPLFLATDKTSLLAPKPALFGTTATYRLTAVAQTASGETGAQSIVLRRGLRAAPLEAGEWLIPPTGVTATRTNAAFERVTGAVVHTVNWEDATGRELLEITLFDSKLNTVDVPALVALPASGALTARVGAIGADIDVGDFSLDEDRDLLWGIASQPVAIP